MNGFDPYLAAVPLLLGLAAGIVAVRLYPLPVRFLAAAAARRRDLVPALALRRVARQPGVTAAPLLVLLLGVSVSVFATVMAATLSHAQEGAGSAVLSPLATGTLDAFRAGAVLGAAYAAFVIVLALLLTARSRLRDLAYLRALGLSRRQAVAVTAAELAPPFVVALVVGTALGPRDRLSRRARPRPDRSGGRRPRRGPAPRPGRAAPARGRAPRSLRGGRLGDRGRRPAHEPQPFTQDGREMSQIVCDNLVKIYKIADLEVVALQGLDLAVEQGEFIAVVGASGSGKSTLQNILGGMDVPTAGKAEVAGFDLTSLTSKERTIYRRSIVGFVWQQTTRNLLPYLNAEENVELPLILEGLRGADRREYAVELLRLVGMGERAGHKPDQLSGGEQQRVAIAIALANRPRVLFADEPTGELDTETAAEIFATLRSANRELGVTVVVLTHDPLVSEQVDRTIAIRDGRTSTETLRRREVDELGDHQVIAEEFAVLDRTGRLQLPQEYMDALDLERRVRLELEPDHIGVWPDKHHREQNGD